MKLLDKISSIFQAKNDNGISSMRVVFIIVVLFIVRIYFDWHKAFLIEIAKEEPNYEGLTKLFLAMMVTFALALIGKVVQKKYEQTEYDIYEEELTDEQIQQGQELIDKIKKEKGENIPIVKGFKP